MKFYIAFGDWSHDGHGMSKNVLVEAESMERLTKAIVKIKEKYGKDFFDNFANEYDSPTISRTILDALIETNYSLEDFLNTDCGENISVEAEKALEEEKIKTFEDFVYFEKWISKNEPDMNDKIYFNLETIEHMYIHLLNSFGADITICKDYPCFTDETVGYGCFWN